MFTDRDERQSKNNEHTEETRVIKVVNRKGLQIENDLTEEGHLLRRNTDVCQLRMKSSYLGAWLCLVCACSEGGDAICLPEGVELAE